jgi:hypothetical protein
MKNPEKYAKIKEKNKGKYNGKYYSTEKARVYAKNNRDKKKEL